MQRGILLKVFRIDVVFEDLPTIVNELSLVRKDGVVDQGITPNFNIFVIPLQY